MSPSSFKTPLTVISQSMPRYSLRTRLLLAFLFITVVAVASLSISAMVVTRSSVTETLNAHFLDSNQARAGLISDWLSTRLEVLYFLSQDRILQRNLQLQLSKYPNDAEQIRKHVLRDAELWNSNLTVRQSFSSHSTAEQIRRYYPDNASVVVIDRHGGLLGSSQVTSRYDFSETEWWQAAYADGQGLIYIQQPTINSVGLPIISVVSPIIDDSKTLLGFISIEYELNSLANELESLRFGRTGGYVLVTSNKQTLSSQGGLRAADQSIDFIFDLDMNQGQTLQQINAGGFTWLVNYAPVTTNSLRLLYDIDRPIQASSTNNTDQAITAYTYQQAIVSLDWKLLIFQEANEAYAVVDRAVQSNILTGIIVLLLASIFSYIISRSISAPIQQLTNTVKQIGQGDLTQRIPLQSSHDELAQLGNGINAMSEVLQQRIVAEQEARAEAHTLQLATLDEQKKLEDTVGIFLSFVQQVAQGDLEQRLRIPEHPQLASLAHGLNGMVGSLNEITLQVRQATDALAAASAEILAATAQQATSATEQSAAISRTAFTIEQVKTIAIQTAERADLLSHETQATLSLTQQGTDVVEETIQAMRLLRTRVESIATTILALAEQTQAVSTIVALVGDLADQSNLLALNAAIEAARAGEHGKSFAVVAQHVRALAEQSKAATLQIKEVLSEIQKSAQTAVLVTEEGTKGAEVGSRLATKAGELIHRVAAAVEHGSSDHLQIAQAAQQQTIGVDQIDQAMANIQQTTIQALASTRQAEQAVQDLHVLSQSLQQVVRVFQQKPRIQLP